jgi:hypothetical protein
VKAEGHVEPVADKDADTLELNCTGSDVDYLKLYLCATSAGVPGFFQPENDKTRHGFPRRVLLVQFGLLAVGLTTRASDAT